MVEQINEAINIVEQTTDGQVTDQQATDEQVTERNVIADLSVGLPQRFEAVRVEDEVREQEGKLLEVTKEDKFTIKVRKDLEALIAPLSRDAYEALKQDIAQRGIQVPIVIDSEGNIIDGHNRYRAALELGIEVPFVVVDVRDDEERIERAIALNANRRQLTRNQIKHLAKMLRQRGWTQERIARSLGVSQAHISKLLREDQLKQREIAEAAAQAEAAEEAAKADENRFGKWAIELQQKMMMLSEQLNIPLMCLIIDFNGEATELYVTKLAQSFSFADLMLHGKDDFEILLRPKKGGMVIKPVAGEKKLFRVISEGSETVLTEARLLLRLIEVFGKKE